MTARECYKKETGCYINHRDIEKAMIEFAKYHVQEVLKEVLYSIPCLEDSSSDIVTYEELEQAILNVYSLENIK